MCEKFWLDDIENIKEEFMLDLINFLKIDSVKDEKTQSIDSPVGKGPKNALMYFFNMAERDGFSVKIIDNIAGHISYGKGQEIMGVLGHVDVVPVGENWNSDPFNPIIKDGKIYARGVLDDKGPLMAAYYALKLLKKKGVNCNKEIRLIVGSDEENDWQCMDAYFKHESIPDFGFSPDGFFPVVNAEKGIINSQIIFNFDKKLEEKNQILSFFSGQANNMVPEVAEAMVMVENVDSFLKFLEAYKKNNHINIQYEVRGNKVKLIIKGKSAHSMNPQKGINSGTILLNILYETNLFLQEKEILEFNHKFFYNNYDGKHLGINHVDIEMGETTICPSIFKYEVGKEFFINLNIRYPKGITEKEILDILNQISSQFGAKLQISEKKSCHYVSKETSLVRTLVEIYERQTQIKGVPISIGGATYARLIENCVAFGALFPGRTNTMHQPDENMWVEDLFLSMSIYAEALYRLTR